MSSNSLFNNLKMLRYKKGWIQEDVAKQLDISIPAYSKIETGYTDINMSRLEQIATLYKVSVISLFGGQEENSHEIISQLKEHMAKKDQDIVKLQKRLIELYKEIHQ